MARIIFIFAVFTLLNFPDGNAQQTDQSGDWIPLFNGKNLEGWTAKFVGHPAGVNYNNTFRVEDGLLTVSYDQYRRFDDTFGHLFHQHSFSHYILRAEYRFIGDQPPGAEDWAFRNNGIMLHAQSPESMRREQEFPVSIEVQLLGGKNSGERSTANLCTPGTNVVMDGQLITQHCTYSNSATYRGDQWVSVEVVVHGDKHVSHIVEGDTVMRYADIQYDDRNPDARKLIESTGDTLLDSGYISIQAESHPTQFRKIEVKPLE